MSRCNVCLQKAKYNCGECQNISYCSRLCQSIHWIEHKYSCKNSLISAKRGRGDGEPPKQPQRKRVKPAEGEWMVIPEEILFKVISHLTSIKDVTNFIKTSPGIAEISRTKEFWAELFRVGWKIKVNINRYDTWLSIRKEYIQFNLFVWNFPKITTMYLEDINYIEPKIWGQLKPVNLNVFKELFLKIIKNTYSTRYSSLIKVYVRRYYFRKKLQYKSQQNNDFETILTSSYISFPDTKIISPKWYSNYYRFKGGLDLSVITPYYDNNYIHFVSNSYYEELVKFFRSYIKYRNIKVNEKKRVVKISMYNIQPIFIYRLAFYLNIFKDVNDKKELLIAGLKYAHSTKPLTKKEINHLFY